VQDTKIARPPVDSLRDYVHFAQRNQTNSLIELTNSYRSGNPSQPSDANKGLKIQRSAQDAITNDRIKGICHGC